MRPKKMSLKHLKDVLGCFLYYEKNPHYHLLYYFYEHHIISYRIVLLAFTLVKKFDAVIPTIPLHLEERKI